MKENRFSAIWIPTICFIFVAQASLFALSFLTVLHFLSGKVLVETWRIYPIFQMVCRNLISQAYCSTNIARCVDVYSSVNMPFIGIPY